MSNDIASKLEKLFLSKTKNIGTDELNTLIKENYFSKIEEKGVTQIEQPKQVSTSDIIKVLPKFEFNEKSVGKVGTADREQFEMFMGPQIKAASDLKSKIQIINNFVNSPKINNNSTQAILSSLMMLKILKNIVVGSSPGPSGYQFESFFAALFGGNQVDVSKGGAVDVLVNGTKYQLKLLKPKSAVRIARVNIEKLKEDIEQPNTNKQQAKNALNFIIANKIGQAPVEKVIFYVLENVVPEIIDGKAEYRINSSVYENENNKVGELNITDEAINKISEALQGNVVKVLTDVTSLVNNINQFYFTNNTDAARNGIDNANSISRDLTEKTATQTK